MPQLLKPTRPEPMLHTREGPAIRSPHTVTRSGSYSPQLEKSLNNTAKNRQIHKILKMHWDLFDIPWISSLLFDKLIIHNICGNIPSHHGHIREFFFFNWTVNMTFLKSDVFYYNIYSILKSGFQAEYYTKGDCLAEIVVTWLSLLDETLKGTRAARIHCVKVQTIQVAKVLYN